MESTIIILFRSITTMFARDIVNVFQGSQHFYNKFPWYIPVFSLMHYLNSRIINYTISTLKSHHSWSSNGYTVWTDEAKIQKTEHIKFPDFSLIWVIFLKFPDFSLTEEFPSWLVTMYSLMRLALGQIQLYSEADINNIANNLI